jgi:hypothetical protein
VPIVQVAGNTTLAGGVIHDARRGGFRDLRLWRRRPVTITVIRREMERQARRYA